MTDDRSLDNMSLKELGALAVSLDLAHWSRLRKAELIDAIRGKLKSQKKAAKSQRRGKGSASKKSASSSRQPTLFDVEEEAPASERSRKKTKRGGSGASAPVLPPGYLQSPPLPGTASRRAQARKGTRDRQAARGKCSQKTQPSPPSRRKGRSGFR